MSSLPAVVQIWGSWLGAAVDPQAFLMLHSALLNDGGLGDATARPDKRCIPAKAYGRITATSEGWSARVQRQGQPEKTVQPRRLRAASWSLSDSVSHLLSSLSPFVVDQTDIKTLVHGCVE